MKNIQKILALTMAMVILLTLAACSKTSSENDNYRRDNTYIIYEENYSKSIIPETTLNPRTVYDNLTYVPQMFYGRYEIADHDKVQSGKIPFNEEGHYMNGYEDKYGNQISTMPIDFVAGPGNLSYTISLHESMAYKGDYNWAALTFRDSSNTSEYIACAYFLDGDTITFRPIEDYKYNPETGESTYNFADFTFSYKYRFDGSKLTFTNGVDSVTLDSGSSVLNEGEISYHIDHDPAPDSPELRAISNLTFHWSETSVYCNVRMLDDNGYTVYTKNVTITLGDNGLFTITFFNEDGTTETEEFVYFFCNRDGLILTNGKDTYYYTDSYSLQQKRAKYTSVAPEDTGKLDALPEDKVTEILEKKDDLAADLSDAFAQAGISATVDKTTGEIVLNSSVIFGGDQAVITDSGKDLLNRFLEVYSSVVFNEKYNGFVSKIMVEGHTAPVPGDTYEDGLPLSVERAENVLNYCISSDTGLSEQNIASLSALMEAVGLSNGTPVYGDDGQVDMNASRRVCFRFIVNLDA